jgi:DNA-binding MurR/RpiR family transcriptional regulator
MAKGHQFFENLKRGVESFSPRQKDIARFVLANYQKTAFANIKEFARLSRTSEATVIRFVKVLGFQGYPAFQREVRRLVRKDLKGLERFKLGVEGEERNTLFKFLDKEFENLSFLDKTFDDAQFQRAVDAISASRDVVIVGTRSAVALAHHLWFGMRKIGFRARFFDAITTELFDETNQMDMQTAVIVIGFPRYLKELVNFLDLLKERGIRTITITDSPFSPIQGDISLYCPAESVSFMAFHAAPILLMNVLLDALSIVDQSATIEALDRFEKIAEKKGYFV